MPPNMCKRLFSYLSDANYIILHYPLIIAVLKVQQILCKAYMSVLSSSEKSIQASKIETALW